MNIERKYIFIAEQADMIADWVGHACALDPQYPAGTISSIYFDTPSLNLYFEKRNSDYVKSKVRLRWYDDAETGDQPVVCFVELKRKEGVSRSKKRIEIEIPAERLRRHTFDDPQILDVPRRVLELEYRPPGLLVPMLLIQYRRRRYVEPASGTRIALDTDIRCLKRNETYVAGVPPVHLDAGVLEIKGPGSGLPEVLQPIAEYLTLEAFSKYARCYEKLMQPLGRRL